MDPSRVSEVERVVAGDGPESCHHVPVAAVTTAQLDRTLSTWAAELGTGVGGDLASLFLRLCSLLFGFE